MALPILPRTEYVVKNKFYPKGKLTLMPFTVGEEPILLQAKDGTDKEKLDAVRQLVNACVKEKLEKPLPIFVIEELFLRLRERSIGEILDLTFGCDGKVTVNEEGQEPYEKDCEAKFPVEIDLREIKIKEDPEHTQTIMLTETIGVKMRYPTVDDFDAIDVTDSKAIFMNSIESIFEGDNVSYPEDASKEELEAFYKSMNFQQKADIVNKFFAKQPSLHYEKSFKCPKCGKQHDITFTNVRDFFL
ncbi:hypothetical protein [Ralstonia phage RSP15]|uniref:hypothetical protein n=1 Tax=Ralstonia phage RSP15 TaxID=1785960 RepID=UPI00074D38DF|nr:hypothetical protein BH754_gp058 [Ralstonia phage RSP15]BAU40016.1 hypothetical protein [Ralstonia phage RSP15]